MRAALIDRVNLGPVPVYIYIHTAKTNVEASKQESASGNSALLRSIEADARRDLDPLGPRQPPWGQLGPGGIGYMASHGSLNY